MYQMSNPGSELAPLHTYRIIELLSYLKHDALLFWSLSDLNIVQFPQN